MSTPSKVEIREVIWVATDRGDDTPGNPRRSVDQYWSRDGVLLADADSLFNDPEAASYLAVERLAQLPGGAVKLGLLDADPPGEGAHA